MGLFIVGIVFQSQEVSVKQEMFLFLATFRGTNNSSLCLSFMMQQIQAKRDPSGFGFVIGKHGSLLRVLWES